MVRFVRRWKYTITACGIAVVASAAIALRFGWLAGAIPLLSAATAFWKTKPR